MRLSQLQLLLLAFAATWQAVQASPHVGHLDARRSSSILINPSAFGKLPDATGARKAAAAVGLPLNNIQGDILIGMRKKKELFYFFSIKDNVRFKRLLASDIHPLITTTIQLLSVITQPLAAVNIAFTQTGLVTLNVTDDLGDPLFKAGQFAGADDLGDPGTGNWVPAFAGTSIHGVFILASDTVDNLNTQLARIQGILGDSIVERHRLQGASRPGSEEGHEHFGFMDGISQPGIKGFTSSPTPGQPMIDAGSFLLGETGDTVTRPSWATDGTFLAFRQLQQLVPEFNKFLADNPLKVPGLSAKQGSDLLGARMVGRWKSGAPIDLTPLADDPVLAADPNRNNFFTFQHPGEDLRSNQTRCPFSAHIRKTRPRADLGTTEETLHHIIRSGIPYGPEVTESEKASSKSSSDKGLERGLAFVSYQSNIRAGFRFIQRTWANSEFFVSNKSDPTPGFDPIIGANKGAPRTVSGLDPVNPDRDFSLQKDFVVSRGGEYFFVPSLSAILNPIAA